MAIVVQPVWILLSSAALAVSAVEPPADVRHDLRPLLIDVGHMDRDRQQQWLSLVERRLHRANTAALTPEEAARQRTRVHHLLRQETIPGMTMLALLEQLDATEKAAIDRLMQRYRLQIDRAFQEQHAAHVKRREAWQRIAGQWRQAGRPFAHQGRMVAWLELAIRRSTPGRVGPLPPAPEFAPPREVPDRRFAAPVVQRPKQPPQLPWPSVNPMRRRHPATRLPTPQQPKTETSDDSLVVAMAVDVAPRRPFSARDIEAVRPQRVEPSRAVARLPAGLFPHAEEPATPAPRVPIRKGPERETASSVAAIERQRAREILPGVHQPSGPDLPRAERHAPSAVVENDLPQRSAIGDTIDPTWAGKPVRPHVFPGLMAVLGASSDAIPLETPVRRQAAETRQIRPPAAESSLVAMLPVELQPVGPQPVEAALVGLVAAPIKPRLVEPRPAELPEILIQRPSIRPPLIEPRPAEPSPVEPRPAEPPDGPIVRVNVDVLAANVAGSNLAIRALEAGLDAEDPWNAARLTPLMDRLEVLAIRHDDLSLLRDITSDRERRQVGRLESPRPAIARIGERISQARSRAKRPDFTGSDRQDELHKLDELSRRLATLASQR